MNILTTETGQDRFLFRAICRGDNFHYGHLAQLPDDRGYGKKGDYCISNKANQPFAYLVTRPETIGQCTGLKDKNGKLIYEGDIVKVYKRIGQIIFDQRGCYFGLKISGVETWGFSMNFMETSEIEIIGNIYENKELLEVAQ